MIAMIYIKKNSYEVRYDNKIPVEDRQMIAMMVI